ncbi:hypothetical protein [Campylobacter avium]|uniref:hypothetical protein n=1 Tax=Campylobacter avium TaxID=522485 RepID=UPI0023548DFD|nr:hypothetical protein [Campylobacter avium]
MSESKIKNDAIDTTNTDISNILNLNTENSNIVSIDKNIRAENIKKLHYILKEINYIRKQVRSNGGKIIFALKNEDSRKAIIQTMVNIYESIKKIQKTNDIDILSLFHKYELKALDTVRNITSHDSEKLNLGRLRNIINTKLVNVEKKIEVYLNSLQENKIEKNDIKIKKRDKIKISFIKFYFIIVIPLIFISSVIFINLNFDIKGATFFISLVISACFVLLVFLFTLIIFLFLKLFGMVDINDEIIAFNNTNESNFKRFDDDFTDFSHMEYSSDDNFSSSSSLATSLNSFDSGVIGSDSYAGTSH